MKTAKRLCLLGAAMLTLASGLVYAELQYEGPGTCVVTDDGVPGCLDNGQNWCQVYADGTCIGF